MLKSNLNKLNHDILIDIIDKNSHLKEVYLVGSSSIGIKNNNDIDILFVIDDNIYDKIIYPDRELWLKLLDNKLNIFVISLNDIKDNMINFAYETGPYFKPIFSRENSQEKLGYEFNILTNRDFRTRVLKKLRTDFIMDELDSNRDGSIYLKKPYRLLATCYILSNNSYKFTKEQKRILNKVHDEKSISNELFNWCKKLVMDFCKQEVTN